MAYFGWPISRSIRETVDHIRCITTDYVTVRVGIGGWISGEGQADNGRDSGPPLPLIARTTTRILDDHEGDNNNEDDRTDDRDEDRRQWERSATVTTCDRQPSTITEGEEGRTWIVHVRERERGRGGVNERVIDRIVIRRTMLDGLRGLGHLMHVVPSPWIRAGVSWMRGEGEKWARTGFSEWRLHNGGFILARGHEQPMPYFTHCRCSDRCTIRVRVSSNRIGISRSND